MENFLVIPNRAGAAVPSDLSKVQQVILEKQTLDVFDNPQTETVIERLRAFTDAGAEFVVSGVVTEYCVGLAVKGLLARKRRVAVVQDAIETLSMDAGKQCEAEFQQMGARLVTTNDALASLREP